MNLKCHDVIKIIEELAPKVLALEGDNVGLQIGDPDKEVRRVMVALDAVPAVVYEAIEKRVDMLITHHPFFYRPARNLRYDVPQGHITQLLIKNDIALYSAHTNLDCAIGGVNDVLCDVLELKNREVLDKGYEEGLKKVVVFVPKGYLDAVRDAMSEAGAGHIGNYSHCTFACEGIGTFKPLQGSNPFIGQVGKLEKAEEYRLETIVPESRLDAVIKAMLSVHPYEEVAYDVYPEDISYKIYGLGRIGELEKEMDFSEFACYVKNKLAVTFVRAIGKRDKKVKKVAVCGGNGTSLIQKAISKGADVMVTGDVGYHQAQDALAAGFSIIDAGHYGTEKVVVPYLAGYIRKKLHHADLEVMQSEIDIEPFSIF
ncbi:dinuclear metal center protein, YbgI/SA1388 family [Caldanaerobius fijiensis DSM 17918]|uniref:GTP cyclohydrolase 1 type 2 homolog n=1 Tax=Caldanaerobius fijiensis DSM 17918 TaxID=1121256 RepID=A0A1M4SC65_9THEO|nr:Nif3-like dinuclear metal center hexameric protein [Caldanaerobius fijiensis]SHE29790.1 dinuclear metal center protein, YbgI/SA1388 family [Caldanaerobius fijiensis DSM 17918]